LNPGLESANAFGVSACNFKLTYYQRWTGFAGFYRIAGLMRHFLAFVTRLR
jgi:hypothetical protein